MTLDRSESHIFNLNSVGDYLGYCDEAVRRFQENQADTFVGISTILALNHIRDWLHFKLTAEEAEIINITCNACVGKKHDFDKENPDLWKIRMLANAAKHLEYVSSTNLIQGYGQGSFGVGSFGKPYLLVDFSQELDCTPDSAYALCNRVADWWRIRLRPILQ